MVQDSLGCGRTVHPFTGWKMIWMRDDGYLGWKIPWGHHGMQSGAEWQGGTAMGCKPRGGDSAKF